MTQTTHKLIVTLPLEFVGLSVGQDIEQDGAYYTVLEINAVTFNAQGGATLELKVERFM